MSQNTMSSYYAPSPDFTGVYTNEFGHKFHFVNGKYHRDNNLPAIIGKDGQQSWWKHGVLHRDVEYNGSIQPAVTTPGPLGVREFYRNGVKAYRHGDTLVFDDMTVKDNRR